MKFEDALAKMPNEFHSEILETDKYLKTMRPLKFRRVVDKNGNNGNKITYVASEHGISYAFRVSDNKFRHNLQWYLVHQGKAETWHRRADYMEETLDKIAKNDYPLSVRIFSALRNCPGFDNCYGDRCLARTPYSFAGKKKLTCHGNVELSSDKDGFCDARVFIRYVNELVKDKIANSEPPPEKIILCETNRSV